MPATLYACVHSLHWQRERERERDSEREGERERERERGRERERERERGGERERERQGKGMFACVYMHDNNSMYMHADGLMMCGTPSLAVLRLSAPQARQGATVVWVSCSPILITCLRLPPHLFALEDWASAIWRCVIIPYALSVQ